MICIPLHYNNVLDCEWLENSIEQHALQGFVFVLIWSPKRASEKMNGLGVVYKKNVFYVLWEVL